MVSFKKKKLHTMEPLFWYDKLIPYIFGTHLKKIDFKKLAKMCKGTRNLFLLMEVFSHTVF